MPLYFVSASADGETDASFFVTAPDPTAAEALWRQQDFVAGIIDDIEGPVTVFDMTEVLDAHNKNIPLAHNWPDKRTCFKP